VREMNRRDLIHRLQSIVIDRENSNRQRGVMTTDKYHIPQQLGARATRRFHAMIKPAGSACNLDCTYCFYLSKQRRCWSIISRRLAD